jgi:hypothetical protein
MSQFGWVLIFIQISGFIQPAVNVQPIYFYTKAACDSVALEMNNGPEPNASSNPKKSFGALCRSTGVNP